MSETQAIEPVNEEVVSDEDASAIAEQQADLDEINNPDQPADPEPEPKNTEPQAQPDDKATNLQKALAESRFTQRQTQRELKEMREAMAALRPQQQVPAQEQVNLDPDNDPIGTLKYVTTRLRAYERQEAERQQEAQQQEAEQQAITELTTYMGEAEQLARTELPDYDHAMNYQLQSRQAELKALGYPEGDIPDLVKTEYLGMIHQARQKGQNPAYLVYQQAKARGYAGPPPENTEPAPETPPTPANGAAQKQLDAVRQGQQVPGTTRGSGGSSSGTVTEEMLLNAKSDKEFNDLWAKMEKQNA